jgi:hypothetical protein
VDVAPVLVLPVGGAELKLLVVYGVTVAAVGPVLVAVALAVAVVRAVAELEVLRLGKTQRDDHGHRRYDPMRL